MNFPKFFRVFLVFKNTKKDKSTGQSTDQSQSRRIKRMIGESTNQMADGESRVARVSGPWVRVTGQHIDPGVQKHTILRSLKTPFLRFFKLFFFFFVFLKERLWPLSRNSNDRSYRVPPYTTALRKSFWSDLGSFERSWLPLFWSTNDFSQKSWKISRSRFFVSRFPNSFWFLFRVSILGAACVFGVFGLWRLWV